MAGITLVDAQEMLDLWVAAEQKVAQGQSYTIGTRTLTRANLAEIGERITYWNSKVIELTNGAAGIRTRGLSLG